MRFTVSLRGLEGVRDRFDRIKAAVPLALAGTAVQIEEQITQAAGKHKKYSRTGALVRSVFKRAIPRGWQIGHNQQEAPHARFVINGTRPHLILPRNKKRLRWAGKGGRFVFSKGVKHPGYKGDPYIQIAAAAAPQLFKTHLERRLAQGR